MFQAEMKGITLQLETKEGVFSPSSIDRGTQAMLSLIEFKQDDRVLDLGCGCGVVGLLASKLIGGERVVMCDISPIAIEVSKENAIRNGITDVKIVQSNGLEALSEERFTKIVSNPPYHVDFSVPKHFIEKGYKQLELGGTMYMVTKRLDWYKNKLYSIFGNVHVTEKDGYYIFVAQKREKKKIVKKEQPQQLSKKLARKMAKKQKSNRGACDNRR